MIWHSFALLKTVLSWLDRHLREALGTVMDSDVLDRSYQSSFLRSKYQYMRVASNSASNRFLDRVIPAQMS